MTHSHITNLVARNIAQRGMMSLMGAIYNLVRQNGKKEITVETANGIVSLDPRKLPARNELIVSVAVGDGERKERAAALQSLMMAMQNPQMQQFMQPQNAYYMASQMFESMGIFDTENYITPLDKLPPPQPDPMQELTIQQMQEQIKQIGVQTQKLISDVTNETRKSEFEQQKAADEMQMKLQESRSLQAMNADKMSISERQLALEERKIELEAQKLELKRQEMLLEAQIEARQDRPVAIGSTGGRR
ncbi:portal protein [Cronobacter phage vB_CsaP_GAP52]|uniref:Portal protein n=1 Tax=Cronobacter phage vB_CsaP_GAP52 TaxID=1141137 RepID=K4FBA4_9CAUD|nr:portal protein [Cronobacter phage vB_CsaP_GAP52]AFC21999.1 portal protein [Cronobacter phage vB_CsaP_GAP52]